ncbi:leucine-rich_repeat domain-containing protein [Hexamita inflata]|uniref:Leucine-rich repeat domain-containing protein n=1 Tax=Hexamita inflata TaxID=28002 RepID=A0AA86Q6C2_9EUKA|nr:leucine-rich repeat domain-containing protein [Hexamita inflata]
MLQPIEQYNSDMIKKYLNQIVGRFLIIQNCYDLNDLTFVTQLNILCLQIMDCPNISNIVALAQLKQLYLSNCQLQTITLVGMQKLIILDLSKNCLHSIDKINKLYTQVNLIYLNLSGNSIVDISALRFLTKLRELYLEENEIVDISSLQSMRELKSVHMHENKIISITPLSKLQHLESVDLSDNNIISISILKGATYLKYIIIGGNKIDDLSIIYNIEGSESDQYNPLIELNIYPQDDATEDEIRLSKMIDNIYRQYLQNE